MKEAQMYSPVGNNVLVRVVSLADIMGTSLSIEGYEKDGLIQGYVISIGSLVDSNYNFGLADRVLICGRVIELPKLNDNTYILVEPQYIKAVIEETDE